jgi:hypothetical protein
MKEGMGSGDVVTLIILIKPNPETATALPS